MSRTGSGRTHEGGPAAEALRLVKVSRTYGTDDSAVTALDGVTLSLARGTFSAVMGPSGSGKSTLLQCAAGLDRPDSGIVRVDGTELTGGGEAELTRFRRGRVGFVFQQYNLLETLTVAQNTVLPLKLAGRKVDRRRAREVLLSVGCALLAPRLLKGVLDRLPLTGASGWLAVRNLRRRADQLSGILMSLILFTAVSVVQGVESDAVKASGR